MPENLGGSPYVAPFKKASFPLAHVAQVAQDQGQTLQERKNLSLDDLGGIMTAPVNPREVTATAPFLSDVKGELTGRYDEIVYGANNEDVWAQQQGILSKAVSGTLKGLNLAATTVAGGFAMVGGAVAAPFTGKLSTIWENPVMQNLDKWNETVDQKYLPNYYSDTEKNAEWYSTDNLFTANFLFDKLIKNSGFAVGAMVSGNIMNSLLKA